MQSLVCSQTFPSWLPDTRLITSKSKQNNGSESGMLSIGWLQLPCPFPTGLSKLLYALVALAVCQTTVALRPNGGMTVLTQNIIVLCGNRARPSGRFLACGRLSRVYIWDSETWRSVGKTESKHTPSPSWLSPFSSALLVPLLIRKLLLLLINYWISLFPAAVLTPGKHWLIFNLFEVCEMETEHHQYHWTELLPIDHYYWSSDAAYPSGVWCRV